MCAGAKASGMADTVFTGTASGDFMVMQGDLQHMTMTLTNPYTGETVNINDVYKVNNAAYDGLGGTDALLMSEHGDMLLIKDADGDQTLKNIEQIIAGDGGDVIVLADAEIQYGNVAIDGGGSGDIIWSNNGNDTIFALDGNDIVDGGGGLDKIYGGWGSDYLRGGNGDDIIYGGSRSDAAIDDIIAITCVVVMAMISSMAVAAVMPRPSTIPCPPTKNSSRLRTVSRL